MTDEPREDSSEDLADVTADAESQVDDVPDDVVDEPAYDESPSGPVAATGHPAVDEVLRSLEGLEGRPVDEHVAVFEEAHEKLRRALSSAADDQD